jgi:Animal haem peroxidase
MAHGGGSAFGVPQFSGKVGAGDQPPHPVDPPKFQGYSHILDHRSGARTSTPGSGGHTNTLLDDPREARKIFEALYNLLPTANVPSGQQVLNTEIPAGYTYLLQFIAHDLVDSTVPFWVAAETGIDSRNMRSVRLQLDTLYGGGPTSCPMAFKPVGSQPDSRYQLRLGRVADADKLGLTGGACPVRDLPRLKLSPMAFHNPGLVSPSNFDEIWGTAGPVPPSDNRDDGASLFVADVRNDDNLVLTQLTVLFSILHNAIANKSAVTSQQAKFACARAAMLTMYHSIIEKDLLPKILHDCVKDGPVPLWDGKDIPLEFSHGVFRLGHAMVNSSYVFNDQRSFDIFDVIGGPTFGSTARDPLPSAWILAWSNFFQFKGEKVMNHSLKFSVRKQMPLDYYGLLPAVAADTPDHVSVRDWLSAAAARMARPDALINEFKKDYCGLNFLKKAAIEKWLDQLTTNPRGSANDVETVRQNAALLANDLPLPLYFLLEAEQDPIAKGQTLGPLGSIIVREVMLCCLKDAKKSLDPMLPVAQKALGEAWNRISGVKEMSQLIKLAEEWGNLADCREIPFIASPTSTI